MKLTKSVRKMIKKKPKKRTTKKNKKIYKKYLGGSAFDISEAIDLLNNLNRSLQEKCVNLEIRIGMITEMTGQLHVYSPKSKKSLVICLYYNNDCISSIQLVINNGIEIRSFTDEMYSGKKYNTLLRCVLLILANKIKFNGEPINMLYSSATNPISAHLLMKNFNLRPSSRDDNFEFTYFIDNKYKGDKENINDVVNKFYEAYPRKDIPILFDIFLTDELIDKSLENFKLLTGEINQSDISTQIKCP
jgi:hypothetical protein